MPEAATIASIISQGREHYLDRYRSAIREYRGRYHPSGPEVMFEPNGTTTPIPYRYFRIDLTSGAVSPPNFTEVNVDPHAAFPATSFALQTGLRVLLHPFVWNAIEFVSHATPSDLSLLTRWVNRWLDFGDTKPQDNDGLSGVVHSVTFPVAKDKSWSFSVDFGSAPVEALEELLDTLPRLGITSVSIGSFTYLETTA